MSNPGVRHDLRGSIAGTTRRASTGDILREYAIPPEQRSLQQRGLDDTALAGLGAIVERAYDGLAQALSSQMFAGDAQDGKGCEAEDQDMERFLLPTELTKLLETRDLFPDVDDLADPLGDPPPLRPWGR